MNEALTKGLGLVGRGHVAPCWDFPSGAEDRHLFAATRKRAGMPVGTLHCEEGRDCTGKGREWGV